MILKPEKRKPIFQILNQRKIFKSPYFQVTTSGGMPLFARTQACLKD